MKVYQTNEIKNITLTGNCGSGKTSLIESMLTLGGVISRKGTVETKNTTADYTEFELHQGGTVHSKLLYTEWKGNKINMIDASGSDDFVGGIVSGLYVTDLALMLLNSRHSVEVGTEIQWRLLKKLQKPTVLVVNHLDHETANFDKTLEDAKALFGAKFCVLQYPVNSGKGFDTIIDVVLMKQIKYAADGKTEISEIPSSELSKAEEFRYVLIELAAENDEKLMEVFFENSTLSTDEILKGIKTGLVAANIIPMLCISAKKDIGVSRLMDFILESVPSPNEMPPMVTKEGKEIKCDAAGVGTAFVFKTMMEHHLGEMIFFKVASGIIHEGADLTNNNKRVKERLTQLYITAGKNRQKVAEIKAGDLGMTLKLKDTKVGHTLVDKGLDVEIAAMDFPEPKHRVAVKAKNETDEEKLGEALRRAHAEDPTLIIEHSKELRQTILHCQGEFHINTLKWELEHLHKLSIEYKVPRIPYRETITKTASANYRHKKQSGGAGQFGDVSLFIEPYVEGKPVPKSIMIAGKEQNISVRDQQEINLPWGGKLVFYNCIVGGVIDARFIPAILKGIEEKMTVGPLTGSYARDIRVGVYDGKMHPVDSNELSFTLAGMNAFKEAFKMANPKIMEPIYVVEVMVPRECMGDVMGDLQGRRSVIQGMTSEGEYEKVLCRVPLAEMSNYATSLRSLTHGRATYTMKFSEYQQVPAEIQDKLLKTYEAEHKEEVS